MFGASAMDGLSVRLSLPSASLFKFPPASQPRIVPAPGPDFTYSTLFQIPPSVYNHFLSFNYPLAVAIIYVAAVVYMNKVNRQRNNQPWPLSRTKAFYFFTFVHNIGMFCLSFSICDGMWLALQHSLPAWHQISSLADVVDPMCKIHGPRGLGAGVSFNSTTNIWTSSNVAINLTPEGAPDPTDLGRLWNEGLAFYGWFSYLSKLYSVMDTVIWLAEGKTSSMLQTFHHVGAMFSLWAGIRYMSPPIWMFVVLNSFFNFSKYFFYTLKSLSYSSWTDMYERVFPAFQISQVVLGATYAFAHLFVSYRAPVSVPASAASTVASAVSAAPSAASSLASSAVTSVASAVSSVGLVELAQKAVLRAVGQEGLADNVPLHNEKSIFEGMGSSLTDQLHGLKEEVTYTTQDQMVPCLDTSGQAFAIWLNLLYLVPFAYLFVRYFQKSYSGRTSPEARHPTKHAAVGKASRDAVRGIQRQLNEQPTPLPQQIDSAAKVVTAAKDRVVKDLGKDVEGTVEATVDGMPGNFEGQGHARQKVNSGDDGEGREDGKPEQGSLVNGNVTKDKQADDDDAPLDIHLDASAKKGDDLPAEKDEEDKSNQDEATPEERDETPTVLQGIGIPDEEAEEPQKDLRNSTKKAEDEKSENGSAQRGQPHDTRLTEDASRRSKNDEVTEEDSEGDSDKENRPASSSAGDDNRDNDRANDDDDDNDNDNDTTESDIDNSMVVVNGNSKSDSPAEQKENGSKLDKAGEGGQKNATEVSDAENGG